MTVATDAAFHFEGVHATLCIERPAPAVVLVRFTGRDVGELGALPFDELAKDIAAHGAITLFIDARKVRGVSIDVSNEWARWLKRHRSSLRSVCMLTGSRFVEVTADFVRRFAELDVMQITNDAATFDAALADAALR
jgi:hypothetical protein